MIGCVFNDRECREFAYILSKELDDMLLDLKDKRVDNEIKAAIESRYTVIFKMYARFTSKEDTSRYARNRIYY